MLEEKKIVRHRYWCEFTDDAPSLAAAGIIGSTQTVEKFDIFAVIVRQSHWFWLQMTSPSSNVLNEFFSVRFDCVDLCLFTFPSAEQHDRQWARLVWCSIFICGCHRIHRFYIRICCHFPILRVRSMHAFVGKSLRIDVFVCDKLRRTKYITMRRWLLTNVVNLILSPFYLSLFWYSHKC